MTTRLYPLVCLLTLCSFTCNPNQTERLAVLAQVSDLPTRDELMNAFRESRKILLVYASQNPDAIDSYAALVKKINIRSRFAAIEVKPCSAVTADDWQTKAIVLIGTSTSNSVLHKIVNEIPFLLNKKIHYV